MKIPCKTGKTQQETAGLISKPEESQRYIWDYGSALHLKENQMRFLELLMIHTCIWSLNDPHGINAIAFDHMCTVLENLNAQDIITAVKCQDGRFYLEDKTAKNLANLRPIIV